MKVYAKSRRIGISWIEAGDAVISAMEGVGGCNTYYTGYNYDMAKQFINDCAEWAEIFSAVAIAQSDYNPYGSITTYIDEENILTYRLDFPNGREVTALSSKPENFRSKKGRIVIDEAAFHKDVAALLKAANAITIWGGEVRVISTHDGDENPFNQLCKKIAVGDLPYSYHETTFREAIQQGLYQKICLMTGEHWSLEKELEWVAEIYDLYGVGATEELDVIPQRDSGGGMFSEAWFHIIEQIDYTLTRSRLTVRFWDLAATEKKLAGKEPCYTAGVKMARVGEMINVEDSAEYQLGPADIDDVLMATAESDGLDCAIRVELEGGSSGIRDAAHLQKLLHKYDFQAVPPRGDKVRRARPWASALKARNVKLIEGDWNANFVDRHIKFPKGSKDTVDASSGAYDYLVNSGIEARDFYVPGEAERFTAMSRLAAMRRKSSRGVRGFR